ncbi:MAG: RluA family pseudouridine synthase [Clostridia bacterium]|nr:RluA family pseudouridine synthase [Clostridia bacterium]
METETILLIAETEAPRIDAYLAENTAFSRSKIQNLIKAGAVEKNGKQCKANAEVKTGDSIRMHVQRETGVSMPTPENIPLDVIYEDADLAVINKPKGMVVHPAPGNETGTLVNALLFRFRTLSDTGGATRPGIVHRIDRMTSGLLVVAKNDAAHEALAKQFALHTAHREYLCLVHGNLKDESGTIDASIGRHKTDRKKMAVTEDGRRAVTHWRVLQRFGTETLLDVRLETGRTHQIRVHMAFIKHPILGDEVYGSSAPKLGLNGQALHGYRLTFQHPKTGETMSFTAPLPDDFVTALNRLGGTVPNELFSQDTNQSV